MCWREVNCYVWLRFLALPENGKLNLLKLMHGFCFMVFGNVVGLGFFPSCILEQMSQEDSMPQCF